MKDWGAYFDLLALAKAGSISGAALELGITQPTMSRRLAQLEENVGTTLFFRTPAGVTPSPAGQRMVETLEQVGSALSRMETEIDAADTTLSGIVRLTVTEGIGVFALASLIRDFNKMYPGIRVEIVVDNFLVNLLSRDAHIAIRLLRPVQNDLITKCVGRLRTYLFASEAYVEQFGQPETKAEATSHYACGLLGITPTSLMTNDLFPDNRHVFRSNSMLSLCEAVSEGIGIGPVLSFLGNDKPNLVRVLQDEVFLEKEIWLTAIPEMRGNRRIRALYDFLAQRLKQQIF